MDKLQTDAQAIEYWNERFKLRKNVGWGSHPKSNWYKQKKDAVRRVLDKDNVLKVLDICCGDCKFIAELPQFQNNSIEYVGIEPTKSIYNQITKEFPDKTFLNITIPELIKTTMNEEFDLIICYDMLFHLVDDKLYDDFIKWMFNRKTKFVIVSYSDVPEKIQKSEAGHYIPRNFYKNIQSIGYWWKRSFDANSTEDKTLKLHIFEVKDRPIGNVSTYKPMKNYYKSDRLGIGGYLIHELETMPMVKQHYNDFDMCIELGSFHGGLSLMISDLWPDTEFRTMDFFMEDGIKDILDHIKDMNTNIIFHHEDLLSEPNKTLIDLLQRPGKKFLYSDNGNKPLEANYYIPYLKSGDVFGTHDWNVEVKWDQIKDVLKDFKPILHEEMEELGLLSRFWVKK